MPDRWNSSLMPAALVVALERAGGEMAYTQTDFAAARVHLGEHVVVGAVDKSKDDEPVLGIKLVPSAKKDSLSVS